MRTTIDIDDTLLAEAKKRAIEQNTSLRKVVETALRESLSRQNRPPKPFHLKWRTVRGHLVPGVDIADRDSVYERMEGRS
ncbi:MAG: type II toxin-antitoxin system VapB family antitoxin [Desulfobacterales bacterium]|nr:type II toxin-antitoxin system VapB family antitoxin [Desulfobacterales bacterium]MCF8079957.1 type II toxin-antitoxin system VapB family antitoxin [Desulfobacterales bacterium]